MSSEADERTGRALAAAHRDLSNIARWASGKTLAELRADDLVRYAVERAFMSLAAALRDIPKQLLTENNVPEQLIASFRNVLAHTYEDVLDARVIATIRDDVPALNAQLKAVVEQLPPESHRYYRRALLEQLQAGAALATPGPDAARSQDWLYDDDGIPG